MPELAYTTVMTTLHRLADKGLLVAEATRGRKAHEYRPAGTPAEFLVVSSRLEAAGVVERYGDAALAAFAAQLDALTPEQRPAGNSCCGDACARSCYYLTIVVFHR